MKRGFTLIETIIYVALVGLLIGSGVVASYYIIDSSEQGSVHANATAEAQFLIRKVSWALIGVDTIHSPASGTSGYQLSVHKNGFASNPIIIDLVSGRARISIGGGAVEITGDRVKIENLFFEHIAATALKPAAIQTSFTADGKNFQMTKYLRK